MVTTLPDTPVGAAPDDILASVPSLCQSFAQLASALDQRSSPGLAIIDPRFEGMPIEQRDAMVKPHLEQTQADIMNLFTFAPSNLNQTPQTY